MHEGKYKERLTVTTESSTEKKMESGAEHPGLGNVAMSSYVMALSTRLGTKFSCL